MSVLRVWAPNARTVTALIEGRHVAMEEEDPPARGWWRVDALEAQADPITRSSSTTDNLFPTRARNGSRGEFMDRRGLSTTARLDGPTIISPRRRCHRRSFTNFMSALSPRRERSNPRSPAWTIWLTSA